MKTKAIIRIVVCSLLFVALLNILMSGLRFVNLFGSKPSGETMVVERSVDAWGFTSLEIEWAAGSITIVKGTFPDSIVIKEVKDTNNPYTFSTEFDDNNLKISYGDVGPHFGNLSGKDLIIHVPSNWTCNDLEIEGAALDIDIRSVNVHSLELSGAANKLRYEGKLNSLAAEGAANSLKMNITTGLDRASIAGMGCKLDLTLPYEMGFEATLEGLGVSFQSELDVRHTGKSYRYGDEACEIDVSGVGCKVSVNPSY